MTAEVAIPGKPKSLLPSWPTNNNFGPKFSKRVMPWVEQFYHERGFYPPAEKFTERWGCTPDQYKALNESKYWQGCLERRGIPLPGFEAYLSAKQVAAISLLTNFNVVEPIDVKLASIGVTEEELNGWYRNPVFKNALVVRADTVLDNVATDAQVELARSIKKGYFPAIKFYFELTGQTQNQEAINVKQAMQVLVEAVQKHVKDQDTLEAIASEVQSLRSIKGL